MLIKPFLVFQKMYSDFELQGFEEEKLNSRAYQNVISRIQMEEATASVTSDSTREEDDR